MEINVIWKVLVSAYYILQINNWKMTVNREMTNNKYYIAETILSRYFIKM